MSLGDRLLEKQDFLLLVLLLLLFLLLSIIDGKLDPLENVDGHQVAETNVLNPAVVDVEDSNVEDPLEERLQRDQFLERGSLRKLESLESSRLRKD